ncbi:hypothetical protein JAG44_004630 [Citrobacter koseri]|uniref:hypothetical protein n=1 Tax=Citrobacter koseri TaxID=545 RepID=UPI000A95A85B|nr:hypothetical protein [Citrobacter koseri]ELJ2667474.1 hypothetical protein [Citrobacter koseri]
MMQSDWHPADIDVPPAQPGYGSCAAFCLSDPQESFELQKQFSIIGLLTTN